MVDVWNRFRCRVVGAHTTDTFRSLYRFVDSEVKVTKFVGNALNVSSGLLQTPYVVCSKEKTKKVTR